MSPLLLILLVVAAGFLFSLPRKWAPLPLLLGGAYFGCYQQLEIGPAHFTASRILVTVGVLRVLMKRERLAGGWIPLDRAVFCWAIWLVASSMFHKDGTLVFRLGMALDTFGAYLLFRVFIQTPADIVALCKRLCLLLVPLAAVMVFEKLSGRNYFELLGGVPGDTELRNGHFRARGPFIHQIAAGNVGAACLPMAVYLWRSERALALAGMATSFGIVFASGSSGPILTVLSLIFALCLWWMRKYLRAMRWMAIFCIIGLDLVMNDPVYYLVGRIDITGGSTGYFRAALIKSSIEHLNEWWLTGTDRTRHWMPSGIPANDTSTDITNHYLAMGVMGGFLLMGLFIWILFAAFAAVGRALRRKENEPFERQFLVWILGCILFGHATTFWSISYFDPQSLIYLFFSLAAIGSVSIEIVEDTPVAAEAGGHTIEPGMETSVEHG